jgi:hypothetical protein
VLRKNILNSETNIENLEERVRKAKCRIKISNMCLIRIPTRQKEWRKSSM